MMKEPKKVVVKAKAWSKGVGEFPSRIVLLRIYKQDGTIREYSTHLEVDNKGQSEFYHGHYFQTLESAEKDFKTRK